MDTTTALFSIDFEDEKDNQVKEIREASSIDGKWGLPWSRIALVQRKMQATEFATSAHVFFN